MICELFASELSRRARGYLVLSYVFLMNIQHTYELSCVMMMDNIVMFDYLEFYIEKKEKKIRSKTSHAEHR